jgi:hypothetical protein
MGQILEFFWQNLFHLRQKFALKNSTMGQLLKILANLVKTPKNQQPPTNHKTLIQLQRKR